MNVVVHLNTKIIYSDFIETRKLVAIIVELCKNCMMGCSGVMKVR